AAVRVSEIVRISASAARNSAEPNAGGGPGRNWFADVRNQGVTPGMSPPATGSPGAFVVQYPGPIGGAGLFARPNPSPWARETMRAPTSCPIAAPRSNQGFGCPGPALDCSAINAASACAPPGNK